MTEGTKKALPVNNCDGCPGHCCVSDMVPLHPKYDDVYSYEFQVIDGLPYLKHKAGGECIYLASGKCSIHERRPEICRRFRCTDWYASKTEAERVALVQRNPNSALVFLRAAALLGEPSVRD